MTEKKEDKKKVMADVIRDRFSEIFLATPYATREDRKEALFECIESGREYTIEDIRSEFVDKFHLPISRVAINSYVNELEAAERLHFRREGLGGKKIVSVPDNA
jgi:hypothetical protein